MKYKNSVCEFREERDADLLRVFRKLWASGDTTDLRELASRIAKSPSKRFWISEERADVVISNMLRGNRQHCMSENKRRMFTEIFRRYVEARKANPSASKKELLLHICNSEAPEFYMTPGTVIVLLHKARKREREKWKRRLSGHQ